MTHCSESSGLSVCVCNNLALRTTAGRLPATWRVYLAMVELWTLLGAGSLCVVSSHTHTHIYTPSLSAGGIYTQFTIPSEGISGIAEENRFVAHKWLSWQAGASQPCRPLACTVTHGLPRALVRSPITLAFLGCL